MARKSFNRKDRARIFNAALGLCHLCEGKIGVAEAWEIEHVIPYALTHYAVEKPPAEGIYEWRVPSVGVSGLVVRSLAHHRRRGAGHQDAISPEFDYWDGYSLHVPTGTQWREPPEGAELGRYEQRFICAEGIGLDLCPFCKNTPKLKGYVRASDGGAVITGDAHRINSWWLECCAWAKSPHYPDPRILAETRRALLSKAEGSQP
jgi:hypothetical protein